MYHRLFNEIICDVVRNSNISICDISLMCVIDT